MTLRLKDVQISLSEVPPDDQVQAAVAGLLGVDCGELRHLAIRKKSLDARRKGRILYHYQVDVDVDGEDELLIRLGAAADKVGPSQVSQPLDGLNPSPRQFRHPPVVVGLGPSGTTAALLLAKAGIPTIVVERGEPVEARTRSVNRLRREGLFDPESHYCYGEGGAGTFSDGKLTCGRNHPLIKYLFTEWVDHGAPKQILYDAHPHIGSDNLVKIALKQRAAILAAGSQILFRRRFVDLEDGMAQARHIVVLDDGTRIPTDHLIVAVGHSARETYEMLLARRLALAPKPFAIGARFEHPQALINKIQFGNCPLLPPAEYKLAAHEGERGIWTFCMCPGGFLLPTGAQPDHLAINGMSYWSRGSGFANAAVVVNVRRDDYFRGHPLDGAYWQAALERNAFREGGGGYRAPAQRLVDFVKGKPSRGDLKSTYEPGVAPGRLDKILPSFAVDALRGALQAYNRKMHGFLSDEALVVGVETKTSSPIVMQRDERLQSVSHPGLFPTGEGAGFAGGIVSAALDGLRVGQAVLADAMNQVTTS